MSWSKNSPWSKRLSVIVGHIIDYECIVWIATLICLDIDILYCKWSVIIMWNGVQGYFIMENSHCLFINMLRDECLNNKDKAIRI